MIGVQYELTNQLGDSIIINDHSDPQNLIALQDYPSFELDIKNQEIQKDGQHGIWDFYSFYGKRLITFSGVIVGEDEEKVIELRDRLKTVCTLPLDPSEENSGMITIKYTDPTGNDLQTTAKIYSDIRFSRVMRENFKLAFQLVLKSADPKIESQEEKSGTGMRGYRIGSIQLPTKMTTKMSIIERQTLEVINLGNAYADPIITIHGPLINPRIENLSTGRYMSFTKTLLDGEYIRINSADGTIVDQDDNDVTGTLDSGSLFIKLKGGSNLLFLTSDENSGETNPVLTRIAPSEELNVTHRDTYL